MNNADQMAGADYYIWITTNNYSNMKKSIKECYAELTAGPIRSGQLTFRFFDSLGIAGKRQVRIEHIDGCECMNDYNLHDGLNGVSIHITDIDPAGIRIKIRSEDEDLLRQIYQEDSVFAAPFEVFLGLLSQGLISVQWLKRHL